MLGRGVNEEITVRSPEYFWGNTINILKKADLVIGNLECAVTTRETEWRKTPKVFHFRAEPEATNILLAGNVGYVSLANNHTLDFEEEGLLDTIDLLESAEISYSGAGRNIDEAKKPAFIDLKDLKIAIIGATDNEPAFAANEDKAGTNYIEIVSSEENEEFLKEEVALAKKGEVDIIVLSLHWGPNMVWSPPENFRKFAHMAIDNGVDIIHGHSAHNFQGIEIYKGKPIMYDTGDFIDDYAVDPIFKNDWSFIFSVETEDKKIEKLKLIPVVLTYARANLDKGDEFERIRERMIKLSKEFKTRFKKVPEGLELNIS